MLSCQKFYVGPDVLVRAGKARQKDSTAVPARYKLLAGRGVRAYVDSASSRIPASSFSIFSLIPLCAKSAATRMAFLIAFALDDP